MSENSLIERCQRGKADAFEQLLELHYDTIYRFAYRWCGDQHNAQDITQQSCMKLARSIKQFQHQSSFTSWLYRLVINCAKDFYKSPTQRNQREESDQDLDHNLDSSQPGSNEQRVYAQQILEHINHLHEDLKDTLILVYGSGLSHQDAANTLGVKESTISWRIHEARKLLKQKFTSPSLGIHQAETAGGAV
ncbi:MAG: RNA polymerase sigma factor [Arenicella sp.]|nr:RNA polymerase sigma factor [Arenicella sp.]